MERKLLTWPTWERYTVLAHVVGTLSVRERRNLFQLIRSHADPQPDLFFPNYGFSLGEFATWHILNDRRRKGTSLSPTQR